MDDLVELKKGTYTIRVEIQPDTDEQIEAIEAFVQATPEERARLLAVGEAHRYAAS